LSSIAHGIPIPAGDHILETTATAEFAIALEGTIGRLIMIVTSLACCLILGSITRAALVDSAGNQMKDLIDFAIATNASVDREARLRAVGRLKGRRSWRVLVASVKRTTEDEVISMGILRAISESNDPWIADEVIGLEPLFHPSSGAFWSVYYRVVDKMVLKHRRGSE
jgi:hypothetical protein